MTGCWLAERQHLPNKFILYLLFSLWLKTRSPQSQVSKLKRMAGRPWPRVHSKRGDFSPPSSPVIGTEDSMF